MNAAHRDAEAMHAAMNDAAAFSQAALPPTQRVPRNLVNNRRISAAELDAIIQERMTPFPVQATAHIISFGWDLSKSGDQTAHFYLATPEQHPAPTGVPESESEAMLFAFISSHADGDADFSAWGDLYDPARDTFRPTAPPPLPADACSHLLATDEPAPPLPAIAHALAPWFNRHPRRSGVAVITLLLALLGLLGRFDFDAEQTFAEQALADTLEPAAP